MSVTSGFFNSVNGDRRYNAEQMSAIFNGIINDGVFMNIGTSFGVRATTGYDITVGVGRAWFNGAWIYNDSVLPINADISELVLDRYDAVVIEVNHTESVREGNIKIIKGSPSSSPKYPDLTKTTYVNQYPLAYIYRKAGSTVINQADITNMVGTSSCPYVTGILEIQNIDNIVAQWQGEWDVWKSQWEYWKNQWNQWFEDQMAEADAEATNWLSEMKSQFEVWFNSLKIILDGDVAANLGNAVVELQDRFSILASQRAVYEKMQDSSEDFILDNNGNPIEGRTVMGAGSDSGGSNGSSEIDLSDITPEDIGAAAKSHADQHSKDGSDPLTPEMIDAANRTHASQHAIGGSDPITPGSIGAATASHTHSWSEVTSKPSTFPPSTHTHTASQVGALPITGGTLTGDLNTSKGSIKISDSRAELEFESTTYTATGAISLKNPSTLGFNDVALIFEATKSSSRYIEMYLLPNNAYNRGLYIVDYNGNGGYISSVSSYAEMTSLGYTEDAVNALLGVDEE